MLSCAVLERVLAFLFLASRPCAFRAPARPSLIEEGCCASGDFVLSKWPLMIYLLPDSGVADGVCKLWSCKRFEL